MKDLEEILRSHQPAPRRGLGHDFTASVLGKLPATPKSATWYTAVQELYMKFKHLPRLAAVAVVATGTLGLGGASYAAYQWLEPKIDILHITSSNDDGRREYSIKIDGCGVVVGGTPIGDGIKRFEVAKDAGLTDDQVKKVIRDTCLYQSATQFSNDKWPANPTEAEDKLIEYGPLMFELYNRPGVGTVQSISPTELVLTTTVYNGQPKPIAQTPLSEADYKTEYYPKGKTETLTYQLDKDVTIWQGKTQLTMQDVQPGDTLFIGNIKYPASKSDAPKVDGLVRLDIDTAYIQMYRIGNPALAGPVHELVPCDHSPNFLCRSKNNLFSHSEIVYATAKVTDFASSPADSGQWTKNNQYLRSDIEGNEDKYYHSVEGRIIAIKGQHIAIRSRGDTQTIRIDLPYDVVDWFNSNHKTQLAVGDMIEVDYFQKPGEKPNVVKEGDLVAIQICQYQLPDGSYTKY